MTWQQQSTEGKHATECLLVSRRLLLLSRLFWKNVSHPLYMFNRLCTTHIPYYKHLAIQSVHSLRTNKNKKTTEIQWFISGFSSHILTMLQWYCFGHCQQIFTFLFKATKCYACVYFCVFTFVEGLRTSCVPSESLSWKAKAKENKTMRTCAYS